MMCSAACFFGLVLGELEEIYASANMKVKTSPEVCEKLQHILNFL